MAQAFYTQAWVSKTLYPGRGLVTQEGLALQLEDVAIVKEFCDYSACFKYPEITDVTLARVVAKLKRSIEDNLSVVLHPLVEGDTFQCEILLSPYPSILMQVMNGTALLGTIILLGCNQVVPCFVCDARIEGYVALLKHAGSSWGEPALMNGGNNGGEE